MNMFCVIGPSPLFVYRSFFSFFLFSFKPFQQQKTGPPLPNYPSCIDTPDICTKEKMINVGSFQDDQCKQENGECTVQECCREQPTCANQENDQESGILCDESTVKKSDFNDIACPGLTCLTDDCCQPKQFCKDSPVVQGKCPSDFKPFMCKSEACTEQECCPPPPPPTPPPPPPPPPPIVPPTSHYRCIPKPDEDEGMFETGDLCPATPEMEQVSSPSASGETLFLDIASGVEKCPCVSSCHETEHWCYIGCSFSKPDHTRWPRNLLRVLRIPNGGSSQCTSAELLNSQVKGRKYFRSNLFGYNRWWRYCNSKETTTVAKMVSIDGAFDLCSGSGSSGDSGSGSGSSPTTKTTSFIDRSRSGETIQQRRRVVDSYDRGADLFGEPPLGTTARTMLDDAIYDAEHPDQVAPNSNQRLLVDGAVTVNPPQVRRLRKGNNNERIATSFGAAQGEARTLPHVVTGSNAMQDANDRWVYGAEAQNVKLWRPAAMEDAWRGGPVSTEGGSTNDMPAWDREVPGAPSIPGHPGVVGPPPPPSSPPPPPPSSLPKIPLSPGPSQPPPPTPDTTPTPPSPPTPPWPPLPPTPGKAVYCILLA